MNGHFITLEGGEGVGKTSIIQTLKNELINIGYDVITTREPGGIEIAEQIRDIILSPINTEMDARTEALLYAAARRQHLVEKVFPALEEGKLVLCDRFIDSSLAYQGYARGIGMEEVYSINKFAIQNCMPHLTLLLDMEPIKGLQRIEDNKHREKNRLDLEDIKFHESVYEAYHILAEKYPARIKLVNADQTIENVATEAVKLIASYLKNSRREV